MTLISTTTITAAAIALLGAATPSFPAHADSGQAIMKTAAPKALKTWAKAIGKQMQSQMRAPERFGFAREFGAATYALTVSRDGTVLNVAQTQSAGYARLDDSAASTITRMNPLPAMPSGIKAERAIVHLKLAYLSGSGRTYTPAAPRRNKTDTIDLTAQQNGVKITLLTKDAAVHR